MSELTFTKPTIGSPDFSQDPLIVAAFTALLAWANGNIDAFNITPGSIGSALVNKEIPRLNGQIFKEEKIASGVEHEMSASRPVLLSLKIKASAKSTLILKVEGNIAAEIEIPAAGLGAITGIIVGPKEKINVSGSALTGEATLYYREM